MDISEHMSISELARNYRDSTALAQPKRNHDFCGSGPARDRFQLKTIAGGPAPTRKSNGRLAAPAGNQSQRHLFRTIPSQDHI